MSQPSSLTKTFDTSLVDVNNPSFSSTETNTSGSTTKSNANTAVLAGTMSGQETYTAVSNSELYDQWAQTYDTDGNVLQAVDDLELRELLPEFARLVGDGSSSQDPIRLLDFGCGTGRNTAKLLTSDWNGKQAKVTGWDASQAMLNIAHTKCSSITPATASLTELRLVDFPSPSSVPDHARNVFDGVISTLVLEHVPAQVFFETITTVLRPGGHALVTNMHPDMGRVTRAGYKTASGERVKGDSYAHGVVESKEMAEAAGLEVLGVVREKSVDEGMLERREVGDRGHKWTGVSVWYGMMLRRNA